MADNPRIEVRGVESIQAMLKEMPYGTRRIAAQAATDYLIGDDTHGLKHYPPQTTQMYTRTYNLQRGWGRSQDEYNPVIRNAMPYAMFVPRWKKYGWREWMEVIETNTAGAIRHAQAMVNQYLDKWR
jgi:hypothetical protein